MEAYYEYAVQPGFFVHHWNVLLDFRHVIWGGVVDTLYMTGITVALAYAIGMPLGILLVCLGRGGILQNRPLHALLGFIINTTRSIPFLILLIALIPFSRFVVGTSIGNNAVIVALVVAASPFIARMVETAINEVDSGVIDAARSMGATNFQIITKVMLPETVPTLIRGASIVTITVISFSAMGGMMGSGGLGALAIRHGLNAWRGDVMLIIIVVIVIIVTIIQFVCNFLASKIDRRL